MIIDCNICEKWSEYKDDYGTDNSERKPDNCSMWLCNDGGCPLDEDKSKYDQTF